MVSISYIIPTFNNLELLQRCIYSIEPQLEGGDKIVIVNDGSSDGTKEYLHENFNNNRNFIILNQPNSGAGCARNLGIRATDSEYIWLIDADDYLVEQAAAKVKEELITNHYDVLFIGYSIKINNMRIEKKEIKYDPDDKVELFLTEHYPWNKIIKRSLFQGVNFPVEKMRYDDHATIPIIISKAKQMGVIPESLYIYDFSHLNNKSKNKKRSKDIYNAFQYLLEHYNKKNLKKEELELLYIKKFIFDELYIESLNFMAIYTNAKEIRKYLNYHIPYWNKSILLKTREVSSYSHLLKFLKVKVIIGNIVSVSPFIASIFIYFISLIKPIYVSVGNYNKISKNHYPKESIY